MKLKFKALATATLLAVAAHAGAVVNTAQSGNSDLFLSVYNPATDRSYTRDLGIRLSEFLPSGATRPVDSAAGGGVDYAFNPAANPTVGAGNVLTAGYRLVFGADSLLLDFLGTAGALPDVVQWGLHAGDSVGGAPGARRYLATSNSGATAVGQTTTSQLGNFGTQMDIYLAGVNPLGSHPSPNLAGSNPAGPADGAAHVPALFGFNFGSFAPFSTGALVNAAQSFYMLQNTASSSLPVLLTPYTNATWSLLSDGSLVYSVSAIPEPGAWAMLIAGLLGVAGISRRRLADPSA